MCVCQRERVNYVCVNENVECGWVTEDMYVHREYVCKYSYR